MFYTSEIKWIKSRPKFFLAGLLLIICVVIFSVCSSYMGHPIIGLGMARLFLGVIFLGFATISLGTFFLVDNVIIRTFFLFVTLMWIIVWVMLWTGVIP